MGKWELGSDTATKTTLYEVPGGVLAVTIINHIGQAPAVSQVFISCSTADIKTWRASRS